MKHCVKRKLSDYWVSGRANCNPHRVQPSTVMIRTTRALIIRTVCRGFTFPRTGAEGISSDTCERRRTVLRMASSAPPALSLSKVQNSTNSLPCPLTPRTNTGIASERRTQRRRSRSGWLAVASSSPPSTHAIIAGLRMIGKAGLPEMTSYVEKSTPRVASRRDSDRGPDAELLKYRLNAHRPGCFARPTPFGAYRICGISSQRPSLI